MNRDPNLPALLHVLYCALHHIYKHDKDHAKFESLSEMFVWWLHVLFQNWNCSVLLGTWECI